MSDIRSCLSCGGLVVSITLVGCNVILSLLRPFTARSSGSKRFDYIQPFSPGESALLLHRPATWLSQLLPCRVNTLGWLIQE
ncbi:uncharacterized protein BKA55DRAFT_388522 [Fusarium redolens]|uniref:Uncharacterized protein n=1 Tax=Fusarium redolens TaxID=48865 RepID=A0A9P9KDD1_FUSRE|nr:uncharacterized protein BKA55DRAFT_388522 [Fusarium redolens]KAH7248864.1 hypothetical protein BKA55DRAFT_388522 [Fusarium redolens]